MTSNEGRLRVERPFLFKSFVILNHKGIFGTFIMNCLHNFKEEGF